MGFGEVQGCWHMQGKKSTSEVEVSILVLLYLTLSLSRVMSGGFWPPVYSGELNLRGQVPPIGDSARVWRAPLISIVSSRTLRFQESEKGVL